MKNYRKNLMILVITFLFSLTLGGCSWPNDNNVVKDIDNTTNQIMDQARNGINALESVAYLGIKDADLAAAKGEGLITRTTVGEEATIVFREYDERVFDIETRGKYMVDAEGAIERITYPFTNVGRQEIYDKIKRSLGEPTMVEGDGISSPYKAIWTLDNVQYVLTDMYNDITLELSRTIK